MSLQNTTHLDRIKELLSDTKRQLDAASSSVFDLERSMAPIVEATQRRRKAASHMAMAIDELRQLCVHLRVADQAELRLCEWYLFNRSAMFFSTAAKLKESSAYLDAFVGASCCAAAVAFALDNAAPLFVPLYCACFLDLAIDGDSVRFDSPAHFFSAHF